MNIDNFSIRNKILLSNGIALVLMVVVAITVLFNLKKLQDNIAWVTHTHQVIAQGNLLTKFLVDMETGMRGFLITGDEKFLEPYESGTIEFENTIKDLKKTVSDNPDQVVKLQKIHDLEEQWKAEAAIPAIEKRRAVVAGAKEEVVNPTTFKDVIAFVQAGTGKRLMDTGRELLHEFIETEQELVQIRNAKEEDSANLTILVIIVGTLISIVIAFLSSFFISRKISDPLNDLVFILERMASEGDLNQKVHVRGTDESARLGNSFNKLMGNLQMVIEQTNVIAQGNYTKDFIPLSQNDQLGKAINQMLESLRTVVRQADIIAQGDYSARISPRSDSDSLGLAMSKMTRTLWNVTEICEAIAKGDYSMGISIKGDKDQLGKAVNQMLESLRGIVNQANTIAKGDYSLVITPRGENDSLGLAMSEMTQTLREVTDKTEQQNWLKTGQNMLLESMRGDWDEVTLARRTITTLAKYLNAQIGAFYLAENNTNTLKLHGSYAFNKRKNLNERITLGEGLVGQAAFEQEMISITNVPENYTRIHSAIGDEVPRNVLVSPFMHEGKLKGVIELGSFQEFSDLHMEFLDSVMENVAIMVNSSQVRTKTQELLDKTQQQAEELQAQQEELRAANEELEEQTKTLQLSEERLQAQQEELKASNEELEAQTRILELQQTEVREKNIELEQAKFDIEEKAQALELSSKYKSEFLANMSHELRSPLNSLLLFAEMLKDNQEGNLTEKQVMSAKNIHESGVELLHLINEVLDLAKVESGKMDIHVEPVPLNELTNYVQANFEHLTEKKGLGLQIQMDKNLPESIQTDQQKVCQILKNFLSNAIKFTREGSISFSITPPTEEQRKTFRLSSELQIALSVSDTGEGIPKEKQQMIFEAFQQVDGSTSRKYGGTGLGLSISRELSKLLQGSIGLESAPGKGSTFTLYLPASPTETIPPAPSASPPKSPSALVKEVSSRIAEQTPSVTRIPDDREVLSASAQTLLIIEDDTKFIQLLSEQAHQKGFQVLIAQDGEAGVQMAQEYRPTAIILDIGLPKLDGWMVMDHLKTNAITRHIPVHFISASDESQRALQMGAIGFLTKPANQHDLKIVFQQIEELLDQTNKRLLLIEDEEIVKEKMVELIEDSDVSTTATSSAEEALEILQTQSFDCIVLDLHLEGMSGFEFLKKVEASPELSLPPVVIYTGKELTEEEDRQLKRFTQSVVIKGAKSLERLLAEVTLFLHRVEANMPEYQQEILHRVYDPETALEGKTVLIVDDDVRNIFALTPHLEKKGVLVIKAFDGKEALTALQDNANQVDLVLMDIMMPEMDGYEAIQEIRKQPKFQNLPIIALTAKAMQEDREKCLEIGASDYLSKPVDTAKLLSLLRVWLNK